MRDPAEKVVVGYLSPTLLHAQFHDSLLRLLDADRALHGRLVPGEHGGGRIRVQAGTNLATPRNDLVRQFLTRTDADWLFMVDSDMTFAPDVVEQLLARADPEHAPVVGGLCFGLIGAGQMAPVLYELTERDDGSAAIVRPQVWPADTLLPVFATGAACLLIHRDVLIKMAGQRFSAAYPWFQESEIGEVPVSEDITFCWRVGQLGYPVHVDTAVHVGHVKHRELNAASYYRQEAYRWQEVGRG